VLIAILGDVHGNREALEAVLQAAKSAGAQRYFQVGDVVGYGPEPGYCLERLLGLSCRICLGNHDAAVLGKLSIDEFNPYARMAVEWTRAELEPKHLAQLEDLELQVQEKELDLTIVHGSLYRPETFDYVRSLPSATRSLESQQTRYCFVGHSHVPCLFTLRDGEAASYEPSFERDAFFRAEDGGKILVNVGSVGQPRDEDNRAAFVLFDSERDFLRLIRVPYEVEAVQKKILSSGLPAVLAERLRYGL